MRIAFCGMGPKYDLADALRDRWPDLHTSPVKIEQYPRQPWIQRLFCLPYSQSVEHLRLQTTLTHYITPLSLYDLFVCRKAVRRSSGQPSFQWWMRALEEWRYDALFYLPPHPPAGSVNDLDEELRIWLQALHVPYNTITGDFEEQLSQVACVLGLRLRPAPQEELDGERTDTGHVANDA